MMLSCIMNTANLKFQAQCATPGANIAHIGNKDAIDLINESIRRCSFDGRVGAKDTMGCSDSFNEQAGVEWGVYSSWSIN